MTHTESHRAKQKIALAENSDHIKRTRDRRRVAMEAGCGDLVDDWNRSIDHLLELRERLEVVPQ